MNLDRVTITGADNSITPNDLVALSQEFPFVEWGILASESNTNAGGSPRFPGWEWMVRLQATSYLNPMKLSLHLCGRWVRGMLAGRTYDELREGSLFQFQRVQLNFHADKTQCYPKAFAVALKALGKRQIIFQIDGERGNEHLQSVYELEPGWLDAVGLFDVSGGAGISPTEWPKPYFMLTDADYAYHGYAGGLGPDNLERELGRISGAAGDCRIWIDMETKVRSSDDRQFDLVKVRRCLEIAAPFVQQTAVA